MRAFAMLCVFSSGVRLGAAGPCDIFNAAGTPCVAAHSVVRALYDAYNGPLYLVEKQDSTAKEIGVLEAGGFANAADQESFCAEGGCTITRIFDQSPKGNHLEMAPAGGYVPHPDKAVRADAHKLSAGGHTVYGAYFEGGMGYRNDRTSGVATGEDPQTMYMVTSGRHYNDKCCFDYGNAETDNNDDGDGTMETVYFGTMATWSHGAGSGPWVMADIENGVYASDSGYNKNSLSMDHDFVTALVKGRPGGFALKGGDATSGDLTTFHEGNRPTGYETMRKQGAIILGIGGDNSNWAVGTFYEGAMTTGYSSDATDRAVQANIVAAGYTLTGPPTPPSPTPAPPTPSGPWQTFPDKAITCSADEYKGDQGQMASGNDCLTAAQAHPEANYAVWRNDVGANQHCHICDLSDRGASSTWQLDDMPGAVSFIHQTGPSPPPPSPSPGGNYEQVEVGTNDYCTNAPGYQDGPNGTPTDAACRARCDADDQCTYYAWWSDEGCRTWDSCPQTAPEHDGATVALWHRTGTTPTVGEILV